MLIRRLLMICFSLLVLSGLSACASLGGREPVKVNVVAVEPLAGQGLELRLNVKLRVQNPNDTPIEFDGVALDLEVRGKDFASGVSDQRGTVPRYGELVVTVPVTVSATAVIRQALSFAVGSSATNRTKLDYQMRGKLAGAGLGGLRFSSSGELELPASVNAAQ